MEALNVYLDFGDANDVPIIKSNNRSIDKSIWIGSRQAL
jgi:hypothetical protein